MVLDAQHASTLPSGLHPWLALAGAVALFAVTNLVGGSGYLAVYLAGIVVANRPVRARNEVLSVQDAATWFAQLVMFLLLGLLRHAARAARGAVAGAGRRRVPDVRGAARGGVRVPGAVRLSPGRKSASSRGPGCAARSASSSRRSRCSPGLPNATLYFNVAFVVVLVSLLVQGWTLARAAHWFGVAVPRADPEHAPHPARPARPARIRHGRLPHRRRQRGAARRRPARPRAPGDGRARRPRAVAGRSRRAGARTITPTCSRPSGQAPRLDWLFAEGSDAREAEQDTVRQLHPARRRAARRTRAVLRLADPGALRPCDRGAVVRRALRRTAAGRRSPHARQGGAGGAQPEGRSRGAGGTEVRGRGRALDSAGVDRADHARRAATRCRFGSSSAVVIASARRPNPHTASGPST